MYTLPILSKSRSIDIDIITIGRKIKNFNKKNMSHILYFLLGGGCIGTLFNALFFLAYFLIEHKASFLIY